MRCTREGLALIREFEGCALAAYQDSGGIWTIGWGRTRGVKQGDTCTQDQADAWLLEDVAEFEGLVAECVPAPPLNENQFSALVSFCYNLGMGVPGERSGLKVLKSGKQSTLLICILAGDFDRAAEQFPRWAHIGRNPSAGLLRRRLAEQALFLQKVGGLNGKD